MFGWSPERCRDESGNECPGFPQCRYPGGTCREIQNEATPEWTQEFATAVEVYRLTREISGFDMNGYPQITRLEMAMECIDGEAEDKAGFLRLIGALHNYDCQLLSEKYAAKG